jgi:hypothetical protein
MTTPIAGKPRWSSRILKEIRAYPLGYGLLGIFVIAGPFVTHFLFPEAPTASGIVGGLVFGAYAALCAVPEKFFE